MPHVDIAPTFKVEFTSEEFGIVTRALAGLLHGEEEREQALCINQHLCYLRAKKIAQMSEHAEKSLAGAEKLLSPAKLAEVNLLKEETAAKRTGKFVIQRKEAGIP